MHPAIQKELQTLHMDHNAIQEELQAVHMHHAFQKELQTDITVKELQTDTTVNMEQAIQEEVLSKRNCLLILLIKGTKLMSTRAESAQLESTILTAVFMVCFIFSNFYFASFFYLYQVETLLLA